MPKFVCMDCGCREVSGVGIATAQVNVDEDGVIVTGEIDWDDFSGMTCNECGSDNVLPVGTGRRYRDAV